MGSKPQIYHEKQVKELCALHALNNLFQTRNTFSQSELDSICSQLSPNVWINPHRSMLGLGNYDINVIMAALQKKGCEAVWFDKRKDPGCLDLSNICGFILNVPSDYKLGFVMLPLHRRHWIAIRQIQGNFYNLDSKLDSPLLIGRSSDLIVYLKEQLECKEKELFVVVSREVEEKQLWINQYTSDQTEPTTTNHHKEPTSNNHKEPTPNNHHTASTTNNHHTSDHADPTTNNHLYCDRIKGINYRTARDSEQIVDTDYNEYLDESFW